MQEQETQTEGTETMDVEAQRKMQAEIFGLDTDPLAQFVSFYEESGLDPLEMYVVGVLDEKVKRGEWRPKTVEGWKRTYRYWREHMAEEGRHPACPNKNHVKRFIQKLRDERGHSPKTIKEEMSHLQEAYAYWADEEDFPHDKTSDPFTSAVKSEWFGKSRPEKKLYPTTVEQLREKIAGVTHIRDRAIIMAQLKLGIRVSEVCNLQLEDVSLEHGDLKRHYPALGTNDYVADRPNAIYIASKKERAGNKSASPRVLPLDDEMRSVLIRYLLIRPDSGEPWVFLTKKNHTRLDPDDKAVNRAWKDAFHPEYAETDKYRPVTSHYGRHRFVTFWRNQGVAPEHLKYMRGDAAAEDIDGRDVLNKYIHMYYDDIEDVYRENIYKLLA